MPEGSVTSLSRGAVNYGALEGRRPSRRQRIVPPRTHWRPSGRAGSARFVRPADVLAPGVPRARLLADGAYDHDMSEDPTIAILEPAPRMMIAVNPGEGGGNKVYLHAGGQGFWVARMAAELGARPRVCAPLGGRSGGLLPELMRLDGVEVVPVACHRSSSVWISNGHDGDPASIGETDPPPLDRHEVDELYSATLAAGLAAGIAVLTGPPRSGILPADVYRRLASDLSANGARVVADVAMEALEPVLAGGVDVLKVSDEDLLRTGRLRDGSLAAALETIAGLRALGAGAVVLSRAADPLVVDSGGEVMEVVPPSLEELNRRGAGDAMTGALAAGLARGMPLGEAVPLAVAAGALNVTRRGLGTGQRRAIEELAGVVRLRALDAATAGRGRGRGGLPHQGSGRSSSASSRP
jgi:1-phosphofructokinase